MLHRRSACLTVALLFTLIGPGWRPASVAAQLPVASTDASAAAFAPAFLADGAHLAPGVTLRLAALGRGDLLAPVDAVNPTDDGTRATYAHGDVREWYLRQGGQGAGIEQGITLAAPPAGDGPLALTIATPGAATLVHDAGDAATLIVPGAAGSDAQRWRYDALHVTDATGRVLPARLVQAAGGGIGITADDAGAVYPITVDPFVQPQTLSDPAATGGDFFSSAVAMSADGSTLVVGAYGTNNVQGRAYVYSRSGGSYSVSQTLSDPAATVGDGFGNAVAVSADGVTLVVGALGSTSGTNSTQSKAYVYSRSGGSYSVSQTLSDPAATHADYFGYAVAVSADGSTLVVGAYGVQGRAYVYTRSVGSYGAPQTLSDPATHADSFGYAVAVSADGSTLLVGADGTNNNHGAAYVYSRSGGSYSVSQTLSDPATNIDGFGYAVAVSADGSALVVGADGTNHQGKAYVYTNATILIQPVAHDEHGQPGAHVTSQPTGHPLYGTGGSVTPQPGGHSIANSGTGGSENGSGPTPTAPSTPMPPSTPAPQPVRH